jgi:hypothetical protein
MITVKMLHFHHDDKSFRSYIKKNRHNSIICCFLLMLMGEQGEIVTCYLKWICPSLFLLEYVYPLLPPS